MFSPPLQSAKVLDQLRERIRYLHYSIRTEDVYVYWVRLFIRFHGLRHPSTMGGAEVEAFLSWLANTRRVAASTHKQALSALFLQLLVGHINVVVGQPFSIKLPAHAFDPGLGQYDSPCL
ncbi:MAG: phage integrase N-terminal SAM-like domain-containing protein [Propionivibrio sp.]|nr:phage integrase N-terminal SAM-like domain-containing protein [Propionivibrio sp.]